MDTTFHVTHFADALKKMAGQIFGLTDAQMNDPMLKEVLLEVPIEMDLYIDAMCRETGLKIQPAKKLAKSPRELLQFFGTEYVRQAQDDYWIQRLLVDVSGLQRVLVPDTRFLNEAKALKAAGGLIIKVFRIDLASADGHASETEMAQIEPDLLIGVRTGDLSLPARIANLIALGKFSAAKKYDYRTGQQAVQAYLSGKSLEESCVLLGQKHKDTYVLKNLLNYYKVDARCYSVGVQ
jgi:hypothetical protein